MDANLLFDAPADTDAADPRDLTDPAGMDLYDLRRWDLAYQEQVLAGWPLTLTEQAHWLSCMDEYARRIGGLTAAAATP